MLGHTSFVHAISIVVVKALRAKLWCNPLRWSIRVFWVVFVVVLSNYDCWWDRAKCDENDKNCFHFALWTFRLQLKTKIERKFQRAISFVLMKWYNIKQVNQFDTQVNQFLSRDRTVCNQINLWFRYWTTNLCMYLHNELLRKIILFKLDLLRYDKKKHFRPLLQLV